jgi:hypothetical protein
MALRNAAEWKKHAQALRASFRTALAVVTYLRIRALFRKEQPAKLFRGDALNGCFVAKHPG